MLDVGTDVRTDVNVVVFKYILFSATRLEGKPLKEGGNVTDQLGQCQHRLSLSRLVSHVTSRTST